MREFFRGWRRKIGVLTLVMAKVVLGASLRSAFYDDRIPLPRFGKQEYAAILLRQGLWLTTEPKDVTDGDVPGLNAMIIDYQYMIIPLSLLSAYLLLSNPRPTKLSDEAQVTHA